MINSIIPMKVKPTVIATMNPFRERSRSEHINSPRRLLQPQHLSGWRINVFPTWVLKVKELL